MWSGLGRGESKWLPLLKNSKTHLSFFRQQFTDYAHSTAEMLRFQLENTILIF